MIIENACVNDEDHIEGDKKCPYCWSGFPQKCKCGGLIHAAFGDENYDGDYWLAWKCDKCGYDCEQEE